jgi:hypothetical protein
MVNLPRLGTNKMKIIKANFFLSILIWLILSKNSLAYLDPGTGSLIIQSTIAAVAGAFYTIKLYWFQIRKFISKVLNKKRNID